MFQKPKVPDRMILQKVTTSLPRHGIRPPCNIRVSVHNGTVTLSGSLEFDLQRKAAVHAATGVNGVQRVVDQMTVLRSTIGGWHAAAKPKYVPRVPVPHPEPPQEPAGNTPPESAQAGSTASASPPPQPPPSVSIQQNSRQ
ncbi:MAG: BON domain-containing protein [Planctomycetaceae bacterium]|nr:BON domain-containing protein [Planctomycetaceae bacterium]